MYCARRRDCHLGSDRNHRDNPGVFRHRQLQHLTLSYLQWVPYLLGQFRRFCCFQCRCCRRPNTVQIFFFFLILARYFLQMSTITPLYQIYITLSFFILFCFILNWRGVPRSKTGTERTAISTNAI